MGNTRRGTSMERVGRLREATKKDEYPTSKGGITYKDQPRAAKDAPAGMKERITRAIQKSLDVADPYKKTVDRAAEGINERKRYKKSE